MNKPTRKRKLTLKRETLLELTNAELQRVAGAAPTAAAHVAAFALRLRITD